MQTLHIVQPDQSIINIHMILDEREHINGFPPLVSMGDNFCDFFGASRMKRICAY